MENGLNEWLAPRYLSDKTISSLAKQFRSAKPFAHIVLSQFLRGEKAAASLQALAGEKFFEKRADLFQLKQTQDFASSQSANLRDLRATLASPAFCAWMRAVSGIRVRPGRIDINGSLYEDTDFLLCHDDEIESRRIAFLYYLTDMRPGEGGSLNLFSRTGKKPKNVVKRIIPRANTFAFFEVSDVSFHEVEEMYVDKQRLAIGGWLHG